jgi:hypothetical protein
MTPRRRLAVVAALALALVAAAVIISPRPPPLVMTAIDAAAVTRMLAGEGSYGRIVRQTTDDQAIASGDAGANVA